MYTLRGQLQIFIVFPLHCNENPIYAFLFWELRGLSPNFLIHVSVREFIVFPLHCNENPI
jgi:hypothetical protein